MRTEWILRHSTRIMSDINQKVENMMAEITAALENISIETQADIIKGKAIPLQTFEGK